MNDTELTELTHPEADRLRALLHRAADSLDVTTPEHAELVPTRGRRTPGRWLAVAAAVLLIAAVGATVMLLGDDGDQRIDTGPADPSVTIAPRVLEQSGIWRLPEELDGYRLLSATPASSVRSVMLAVDDEATPTRWLSVTNYGVEIPLDDRTEVVALPSGQDLLLRPVDGEGGVTRYGLRAGDGTFITGTFSGVDREDVVDLWSSTTPDAAGLASLDLPAGLRATWNAEGDPLEPSRSVDLALVDDDGNRVTVVVGETELSAAVAELRQRVLLLDLSSTAEQSVTRRPDLGPGVLQVRTDAEGVPPGARNTLVVVAADGTIISATGAGDEATQLRIINSLRALPEQEFRDAVREAGGELIDVIAPDGAGG